MFTGIIQAVAEIEYVEDHDAIRTFTIQFPPGFCDDLRVGASVSVDGVCLTATKLLSPDRVAFDVILQSLRVTTLSDCEAGFRVNVERAAKDGAEIGGHPISGHIDFAAVVHSVASLEGNKVLRVTIPEEFRRYLFPKGYVAINGASLTLAEVDRDHGWFEVWLIPETRRMTVFEDKVAGDYLNIEIERQTQVVVDTIRDSVRETLGRLQPVVEALLLDRGVVLEDLLQPGVLAITDHARQRR
ncbi:riboflavin synthase subunit alpha [Phenylobacterium sp.]|uniref:riboflavin synthase subunit alpha n=1 Tax=Phenylobacterium sp. TaxID=1871053 RepID=UPI003BAC1A1D